MKKNYQLLYYLQFFVFLMNSIDKLNIFLTKLIIECIFYFKKQFAIFCVFIKCVITILTLLNICFLYTNLYIFIFTKKKKTTTTFDHRFIWGFFIKYIFFSVKKRKLLNLIHKTFWHFIRTIELNVDILQSICYHHTFFFHLLLRLI